MDAQGRDRVIVVSPFGEPNPRVAGAAARAGALGVLDLGRDLARATAALEEMREWGGRPFGVRVHADAAPSPVSLPAETDTVIAPPGLVASWAAARPGWRVLAEVTDPALAVAAVRDGAHGILAKGCEAGGRVGDLTTFVLLQRLLADPSVRVPVWAWGGLGPHTAAGVVAGGAAGVVLDSQLALTAEAGLPEPVAAAVRAMDGGETVVIGGHRVYTRPDLPVAELARDPVFGARDLRAELLPVGQDGAFAARLAARHRTVGGVVEAVRRAIGTQIAQADAGLRIAQGPMTRVSDRPGFAAAVAAGDGLPFLALALLRGEETRRLLSEAAARLEGRPWGVGVLGFVPPELREEQLAAIVAVRPPYALIAGGRPAQAAPLEAAGIATFLHVPSPGLLERFLREGARRLVFEGMECGGHVGPRASLPLWEAQVDRILAFLDKGGCDGSELEVLFAGGVHDARSAAMVAATAAPLTARGARAGVLMGTAYLFTGEAVQAGAITAEYQRTALACARTRLLHTSPGHATRCADTPFVQTFTRTRDELRDRAVPAGQMWAELEQLNLGRLRLASKGLRRDGDLLREVPEDEQRAEGMFMLGDVASLRHAPTTIAALHHEVTAGAAEHLAARRAELNAPPPGVAEPGVAEPERDRWTPVAPSLRSGGTARPGRADVAIVGMACVYPQADGLAAFWRAVVSGRDAVTEVPAGRWDPAVYYDPGSPAAGARSVSKWGGFLPPVPFDALAYGIPPASLAGIEPVQLLALEVAARALADAGYADRDFDRDRCSVIFGAEAGTDLAGAYGFRALYPGLHGALPPGLEEQLPVLTEDSFPGVLANVIAGRIANRLDLGGVNYTVDAACAASLAALDLACKELTTGSSDVVLCGAADTHNGINDYLMFSSVHALSPTGRCATFDAAADGIALGEGAACVVLKRLADAERDGDRVYAVVRAVAGSSDGRSLGLTAPRADGQTRALRRAYAAAGISPAQVGLVEAHGTGTVVGDRTELAALSELFAAGGARPGQTALGSVKSQIGHTKCAAGLAGLIKAARAVHAGVRPPTLHLREPNDYWDAGSSPFFFDAEARPWTAPAGRRVAGVSAFGFGGTNFHAVLTGYDGAPEPEHGLDEWPAELFLLRGDTDAAVESLADLLSANDAAGRPWPLRDLATSCGGPGRGPVRVALVANDLDDLAAKLAAVRSGGEAEGVFRSPGEPPGRVAFLFPGQGSQRPGMLADLFVAFPRLQRVLRAADDAVVAAMFPPAAFTRRERADQRAAVTDTRVAQPALGVAGAAVHQLLGGLGIRPDMAAGHSYGELVALWAAGCYDLPTLLELSTARATAILEATGTDPGTMAAVRAPAADIAGLLGPGVVVANHNGPAQSVISGPSGAVGQAVADLTAAGFPAEPIPVACAFHSGLVAGAAGTLRERLSRVEVGVPAFPVWSNAEAAQYPGSPEGVREVLARQVAEPVRFAEQIEAMYAAGARVFVEAGPGRVLTGLVGRILGDRPHTAVACDVPGEDGLVALLTALARLAAAGLPVDATALTAGRAWARSADSAPRRPGWLVSGHLVTTADGDYLPGGLRPMTRVPVAAATDRDAAVLEYLRAARELAAAQRDVMLGYLGAPAPAAPLLPAAEAVPAHLLAPPATEPQPAATATATATASAGAGAGASAGAGAERAAARPATPDDVLAAVLEAICLRTGYPRDMLDPGLDLEADLSIDSIKRVEIVAELADRIGLPATGTAVADSVVERLAKVKTISGIVDFCLATMAPSDTVAETAGTGAPVRYVTERVPLEAAPPIDGETLRGRRFVVVEDGHGVALELAALLEEHGARVQSASADRLAELPDLDGAAGLVDLGGLGPAQRPVLPGAFAGLRRALLAGVPRLLLVTGSGGVFGHGWRGDPTPGAGARGFVRTAAIEFPDLSVRAVDLDPKGDPTALAARVLSELCAPQGPVVVGYAGGTRTTPRVRAAELTSGATGTPLGPDSVVLLTGGARGITARVALALAHASRCHIEIVGRTLPEAEDPATAGAADQAALRAVLIGRGMRAPAEIEAESARLLAARRVRATLAELEGVAASVRYHALDVRDGNALRATVADVHARHGRLDGVVHGAGVLEDRLLGDKDPLSFARVFDTKVEGARALAEELPHDTGFLVLFGSVAGVFGNRGQADYAAANDALDTFAHAWSGRLGARVLAVDWGPWAAAGGGMVTPELERAYSRRGIRLLDPDRAVAALLAELAHGTEGQVLYVAEGTDLGAADAG